MGNVAERETLRRKYRNPTTVITANGEVRTSEDAQVHVHDLEQLAAENAPNTAGRRFAMLQAVLQPGMSDNPAKF